MRFRHGHAPPERVIWVVACAAGIQTLLQAFDAQMQGSWPRFWLWLVGSLSIGALAGWAETIKAFRSQ